jgi:DNA-directed RNA polymerase subunit beta'
MTREEDSEDEYESLENKYRTQEGDDEYKILEDEYKTRGQI